MIHTNNIMKVEHITAFEAHHSIIAEQARRLAEHTCSSYNIITITTTITYF